MTSLARIAKAGGSKVPEVIGCVYVSKRNKSTNVTSYNYKRGTGGRSSFSGIVATVFGAKSTLGQLVVNRLGKIGCQVIVPYRGDPYYVRDLKVMGDLGQILFNPIDLKDEDSLRASLQYSNVVINLIGCEYETSNFSFDDVHVKGARKLAQLSKEHGVEKFVHVSCMNAGKESSNVMKGGSKFLKSKGEGEEAVREVFPEAIIMRPANFIDINDKFLNYYTHKMRGFMHLNPMSGFHHAVALWRKGEQTIKMPIMPKDVAHGIVNAIRDPAAPGKTYQCVGPCAYSLQDLVGYIHNCQGLTPVLTDSLIHVKIKAMIMERIFKMIHFPLPVVTMDMLEKETLSDELDPKLPTLEDLGVLPENIEELISFIYKSTRRGGMFAPPLELQLAPTKPTPLFSTLQ